jgi:hypothetical protein
MDKLGMLPSESKLKKIEDVRALEKRVASATGVQDILRSRSES